MQASPYSSSNRPAATPGVQVHPPEPLYPQKCSDEIKPMFVHFTESYLSLHPFRYTALNRTSSCLSNPPSPRITRSVDSGGCVNLFKRLYSSILSLIGVVFRYLSSLFHKIHTPARASLCRLSPNPENSIIVREQPVHFFKRTYAGSINLTRRIYCPPTTFVQRLFASHRAFHPHASRGQAGEPCSTLKHRIEPPSLAYTRDELTSLRPRAGQPHPPLAEAQGTHESYDELAALLGNPGTGPSSPPLHASAPAAPAAPFLPAVIDSTSLMLALAEEDDYNLHAGVSPLLAKSAPLTSTSRKRPFRTDSGDARSERDAGMARSSVATYLQPSARQRVAEAEFLRKAYEQELHGALGRAGRWGGASRKHAVGERKESMGGSERGGDERDERGVGHIIGENDYEADVRGNGLMGDLNGRPS